MYVHSLQGVAAAVPSPLPPSSLVGGASAQSLLLCCWHAMKEISLLLGLVVEWAPIGDNTDTLLTHKQVQSQCTCRRSYRGALHVGGAIATCWGRGAFALALHNL